MKILLCSSLKFADDWDNLKEIFGGNGHDLLTPKEIDLELTGKFGDISPEELVMCHKRFYEEIERCDCLYVYNKDDYLGKSAMAEIGYAKKAGKLIIGFCESEEPVCKMFFNEIKKPEKV